MHFPGDSEYIRQVLANAIDASTGSVATIILMSAFLIIFLGGFITILLVSRRREQRKWEDKTEDDKKMIRKIRLAQDHQAAVEKLIKNKLKKEER